MGFEKAGFDVRAGFELWDPAMRVYADNFKHLSSSKTFQGLMKQ